MTPLHEVSDVDLRLEFAYVEKRRRAVEAQYETAAPGEQRRLLRARWRKLLSREIEVGREQQRRNGGTTR